MESLIAIVESTDEGHLRVLSPKLGFFVPEVQIGGLVIPGSRIGRLEILNHRHPVILPAEAAGRVMSLVDRPGRGVEYRGLLAGLAAGAIELAGAASAGLSSESTQDGELIRAPIHGIFYLRPSPGAPPFASAGENIKRGQTVGLIEVMKTFNPVVFDGPNAPESAVLVETLAKDQQEVEAGQPLIRWRA